MRKSLLVVALVATWFVAGAMPAGAADANWSGDYSLKRFAATKTGTSLAASQWEPDFSDTYTFETDCSSGVCIATVVGGSGSRQSDVAAACSIHLGRNQLGAPL